jgi:hypothetical protein
MWVNVQREDDTNQQEDSTDAVAGRGGGIYSETDHSAILA